MIIAKTSNETDEEFKARAKKVAESLYGRSSLFSPPPQSAEPVSSRSADCGRDDSGRFGQDNDCASDGGSSSGFGGYGDSNEKVTWPESSREDRPPPFAGADQFGTVSVSAPKAIGETLSSVSVSPADAAAIAGGSPGSDIFMRPAPEFSEEKAFAGSGHTPVLIDFERDAAGGTISGSAVIGPNANKELVAYLSTIVASDDIKSDPAKRTAAAREFYRTMVSSIEAARKAGAAKVMFNAAGNSGKGGSDASWKGYTIWPRMGFDARLPESVRERLPPSLASARTLLQLHATPEGTKWWAKNGEDIDVVFDLKDKGSVQNKIMDRFLKRFGTQKRAATTDDFESEMEEFWDELLADGVLDGYEPSESVRDEEESRGLRPYGSTFGIRPKVYVVHGAPGAGKADYVAAKKSDGDVVFDFDKVMGAISGNGQKTDSLISYCTDIRELIIDKAIRSPGDGKTWVIATKVSDDMKAKLSDVPVKYVHIDTPKEECLRRIEGRPNAEELREVIEKYFADSEQRFSPPIPGVERRFLGNFAADQRTDPELLRVEKRSDPETGSQRTYLVGYAARFQTDSLLLGDFVERIDPAAFDLVEQRQDGEGRPLETRCLYNHDPNHLLGRFPTTMRLVVDKKGLKYECLLPESRRDIAESVERGDLKGSSFSFVIAEGGERWTYENGRSIRTVTKIKSLLDCGPVTYPAYGDASSVAVAKRSYDQFISQSAPPPKPPARKAVRKDVAERASKTISDMNEFLKSRR